jgi:GDP-4-dehydro-6-deoxy-D-mannose reductase
MTGGRGFAGSRLAPRLERAGYEVALLERGADVCDSAAVDASLSPARPDAVVHLAALTSVPRSFAEPIAAARVNYLGTLNVLRAAARHAPRARVLLVTSSEIYGHSDPSTDPAPIDETAPLRAASPYARSKAAADVLGAAWAARALDVVRARPFNHTGPGQPDSFVASSLARQVAEIEAGRRPAELQVGNLDAVRDFLDVDDVVEAYLRLLDPAVPRGAYNVARGVGVPVRELLARLLARSTARPVVRVDPARWRPADASVGCAERLRRATDWSPHVPLADTLERLLDDWRARVNATP